MQSNFTRAVANGKHKCSAKKCTKKEKTCKETKTEKAETCPVHPTRISRHIGCRVYRNLHAAKSHQIH